MNILVRLFLPCLCLVSIFARSESGHGLIYCPPAEAVFFDLESGAFASNLMRGMPLSWEKLDSSPEDVTPARFLISEGLSRKTFLEVIVQEYLSDDVLVSQLVCHYRIWNDANEAFLKLTPRQNFLKGSKKLTFPVYLNGKKTNKCRKSRESCGFTIPQAAYRHHLVSHETPSDSQIGRLIFSFLWGTQNSNGQESVPFNITTIAHPDLTTNDYHKTGNGLAGVTGFRVIGKNGMKTEVRSEILFHGSEGIKVATDYLNAKSSALLGTDYFCSLVNFGNSLGRGSVSVIDASMRIVKGRVEFFNCSMYVSKTELFHKHEEL